MRKALGQAWEAIKDFFTHKRLNKAKQRHREAADKLDAAVKEMLRK